MYIKNINESVKNYILQREIENFQSINLNILNKVKTFEKVYINLHRNQNIMI